MIAQEIPQLRTKVFSRSLRRKLWISIAIIFACSLVIALACTLLLQKGWSSYNHDGIPYDTALALDSKGRAWLADKKGNVLMLSPEGQWTEYKLGSDIYDIAVDHDDRPWFGTEHAVWKLNDDGTFKKYDSLPAYEIAVDREDRVWIGRANYESIGTGVNVLHPDGHWETYTIDNSELLDDWITIIEVDSLNRVWIASSDGISVVSPDGSWVTYTSSNSGLYENHIDSMVFDGQGQVWIKPLMGPVQFIDNNGNWTDIPGKYPSLNESVLAVDRQGRLWASDHSELIMLRPDGQWISHNAPGSKWPRGTHVSSLEIDAQGRIFAMKHGGVTVFDEQQALTPQVRTGVAFMRGLMYITMIGCILAAAVVGIYSITRSEKASAEAEMPQPVQNIDRRNKISMISFISGISVPFNILLLVIFIFVASFFGYCDMGYCTSEVTFIVRFLAFLPIISAASAIITGYIGITQIRRSGQKGKGLAISGIFLGILTLLGIIGIVLDEFTGLF